MVLKQMVATKDTKNTKMVLKTNGRMSTTSIEIVFGNNGRKDHQKY